MTNSMDINLGSEDNSMNSLQFHWQARFSDNSIIYQFNKDETENKFQIVRDKFNDLRYFYLTNNLDKMFCVDLINGFIFFNNHLSIEKKETKENCRLIFFRRHRIELNQLGKKMNHDINYHLGFQYNDKNGNNRQIVLIIDEQGNWVLGE